MSSETDKVSPLPAPVTAAVTLSGNVTDEIQPADDSIPNGSSTHMPGSANTPNNPVLTGVAAAADEQLTKKSERSSGQESSGNNNGASISGDDDYERRALINLISADLVLINNVKTRVSKHDGQITKEDERFEKMKNDPAGAVEDLREMKKRVKILKQEVTSKHKEDEKDSNERKSLQTSDSADGVRNLDPKVLMKMPSLYAGKDSFMRTWSFQDFKTRYNSLDDVLKLCLLSFSVFPENEIIKKRIMIYWWIGEGFAPPVLGNIQHQAAEQIHNLTVSSQQETVVTPNGDIPEQNATQIAEQIHNLTVSSQQETVVTPNGDIPEQNATQIAEQSDNLRDSTLINGYIPQQNATAIAEQVDDLRENTQRETPNGDIHQQIATPNAYMQQQNDNLTENTHRETPNGDIHQQSAIPIANIQQQNDNLSECTHRETPNGDIPRQNATPIANMQQQNDNLTANQAPTTEEDPNKITKTAEDYANDFFKELIKKGFIEPVHEKHPFIQDKTAGSCKLHPFTRSMVILLAEKANFFDFDKKAGSPIDDYSHSLRACVTKNKMPAQSVDLEKLHTLFNVNEDTLEFSPELLGRMKNLNVLYLGRWQSSAKHHIEVEDVKNLKNETVNVLDGLENLNHLTFLSIQGISRITELPKSLCTLSKLTILDIRACHNLEVLPKEIGLLKNLTHLDMSECYLLEQMPKGLSSLHKLQVLKGFVVTEDSDEKKSCKLKDLRNLPLRKLSIYTGLMDFPSEMDLLSLNQFKGLAMLTIAWGRGSLQGTTTSQTSLQALPLDDGKKKKKFNNLSIKRILSLSSSSIIHGIPELPSNLIKLNLVCFPRTDTPNWLNPSSLPNLERLYIRGGKFSDLGQIRDDDQKAEWRKVEVLRLKYLDELEMEWGEFLELFPTVSYLEKVRCPKLTFFPCNQSGVWVKKPKKK